MKVSMCIILFCLGLMGCDKANVAKSQVFDNLVISHSWIRQPVPGSVNTSGFISITNKSDKTEYLMAAASEVAKQTELHTMVMAGEVMQMRVQPQGFAIPPGKTLVLAPGGEHIMLLGIKDVLASSQSVVLTLDFKQAGKQKVEFEVKKDNSQADSHAFKLHNHN